MVTGRKKAAKKPVKKTARIGRVNVVLPLPPSLPVKIHLHALPLCRGDQHHPWCTGLRQELQCKSMRVGWMTLALCTHKK
jgi:hypothetical protein